MIRDDINKALTEAQKAKNERTVSTLRMVNSTLKNADIEARTTGKPLGVAERLAGGARLDIGVLQGRVDHAQRRHGALVLGLLRLGQGLVDVVANHELVLP